MSTNFPVIDLSQIDKPSITLYLCKPDRTIIARLKEAYEVNLNVKSLQINELSFKIPLNIDYNNTLITNPNIALIKYRYLIKIELNNPGSDNQYTEYFIITTPKNEASEDTDSKHYTCLSLISELADRVISGYENTSFTLDQVFNGGYDEIRKLQLNGILTGTNWKIASPGGISPKFTFRRRSINIGNDTTILNIILSTLVETYNMLPVFDTVNREIYLYSPEEMGKTIDDNILRVSYKKYLQSMDLTEDGSEFTTRLKAKGKEDLGLHTITPTGQPFLENFDYFKQGGYWSDELYQAQINYEGKLQAREGEFLTLLEQKSELELGRAEFDIDAFNALTSLYFTQDVIDVLQGLDKGMYRFRRVQGESSDDIELTYDLIDTWFYYIMFNIESLDGVQVYLNDEDITAALSPDTWFHNTILKNTGQAAVSIRITGATDHDIKIDVCRITEDEYYNDGAREIQIVFLGGIATSTWRLGRPDPSDSTNTLYTPPLAYNISEANLQTALADLYSDTDIEVKKQGSMADGNVYFQIEFPYSLGFDSGLIGDFSLMPAESTPFIVQRQKRILLLDKYNEDLKQQEYNAAMNLVANRQAEINIVNADITEIRNDLALENNFTEAEIAERNNFIIEKTYQNGNIIHVEDLLEAALEYFEEINKPALRLNLNLVNFMEIAEGHYDFDKLFYNPLMTGLYDTIVVRHEVHNINVECMILEVSYNFDTSDISFIVSNVRELLDPESKFLKDLSSSTNAAATLLQDKYKWDGTTDKTTELDDILNSTWDAATRAINSGVNNSVRVDNRGIRITDPNNPMHIIAIVAGWLGISSDGGNNYNTVLNADGIAAKYLIGQIVLAAELHIINQGGNIEIGENGILVYDQEGVKRIHIGDFGDFTDPDYIAGTQYGFYFKGRTDPITGQEHYLEWDGTKLKIGGDLDAVTGTFTELTAGGQTNYMQLHENDYAPYMDFYGNLIKRMSLNQDSINFYDEENNYTGYIKALYNQPYHPSGSVLDIASNDVGSFRSYRSYLDGNDIIVEEGAIITQVNPSAGSITAREITIVENTIAQLIESYIDIKQDEINIYSDGHVAIGSEGDIPIESGGDIAIEAKNGRIDIESPIIEIEALGVNIGKSTNAFISINSIDDIVSVKGKTYNSIVNPASVILHGITGITHVNNSDRNRVYTFRKNGPLPNPDGVINFICP